MIRLISFLAGRRGFTFVITGIYLFFIVFYHRKVSAVFDWLRDSYSFELYNAAALQVSLILLIFFSAFVYTGLKKLKEKLKAGILWCYSLLLVLLSYFLLITVNIEVIHFIQYALLAVPVFALVLRYGETVFWVTLMGAIDEAYQYFVLYRDNNTVYFDFNDVILNLVGAGIGVTLIYTLAHSKNDVSFSASPPERKGFKSPVITMTLAVSLLILGLYSTGFIKSHPEENGAGTFIVSSRQSAAPGFWTVPEKSKPFHIVPLLEGMSILALLLASYSMMDSRGGSVVPVSGKAFLDKMQEIDRNGL